jgi:broad specificity phosphatase PhoE
LKDTDGITSWFDSFLAPEGEGQVKDLSTFWSTLTSSEGAPLPQMVYTSPLARCLQTTEFVYGPLFPKGQFHPLIKEDLRERWTLHTCDRRRPRLWIAENWEPKGYVFEDGFAEDDELAKKDERPESNEEHAVRKQRCLEDVWNADQGKEFIALVCHSIAIRTILGVVGANNFRVREGSSVALLVKGIRME